MTNATERLEQALLAEAGVAGEDTRNGELLRRLAETTENMTPAESTWVEDATGEEIRGFVKAIRLGCPPDESGA